MDESDRPIPPDNDLHRLYVAPTAQDYDEETVGEEFRVDDCWYDVAWGPALLPAWLVDPFDTSMGGPAAGLFLFPLVALLWKMDPRVRLSIRRRKQGRPFARLVAVEFLADELAADARQREIRNNWKFGDYEEAPPLTSRHVRSAYRQARRDIPRPPWRRRTKLVG